MKAIIQKTCVAGMISLMLGGCATLGPRVARQAQYPYNEAIVHSWKEQLLLNLVRLRYRDMPYFLEVDSITSSHTISLSASFEGTFPKLNREGAHKLSPGLGYSEQPIIAYKPLQGERFTKRLLSSVEFGDLMKLAHSGWSIERIFNVCVQYMNDLENAPTSVGPTPDFIPQYKDFRRVTKNLRTLQKEGRLILEVDPFHDKTTIDALLEPGDKDEFMHLVRKDGKNSVLESVYKDLGASTDFEWLKVSGNRLKPQDGSLIRVKTRTLMGIMFYLSQGICVPQKHLDCGLVTSTCDADGNLFDWNDVVGTEMQILSSKRKPDCAAVKVSYRGHWFYIPDNDLNSKSTFVLLAELLELAGQSSSEMNMPKLSIPLKDAMGK